MLCTYCRISLQLLLPYLHKLPICFHSSSHFLGFQLSYVAGPLSWHLLLISSNQWNIITGVFDSMLWKASVLEMRSKYFLCPRLSIKTSWSRDSSSSWCFPWTKTKLCWLTPGTDQARYVLFIYLLFIYLYACLFIWWNLNAVWRQSKANKRSLGPMVEEEAIPE